MSTDTVLVSRAILATFREHLLSRMRSAAGDVGHVITERSCRRLQSLINDAKANGTAVISSNSMQSPVIPASVIE